VLLFVVGGEVAATKWQQNQQDQDATSTSKCWDSEPRLGAAARAASRQAGERGLFRPSISQAVVGQTRRDRSTGAHMIRPIQPSALATQQIKRALPPMTCGKRLPLRAWRANHCGQPLSVTCSRLEHRRLASSVRCRSVVHCQQHHQVIHRQPASTAPRTDPVAYELGPLFHRRPTHSPSSALPLRETRDAGLAPPFPANHTLISDDAVLDTNPRPRGDRQRAHRLPPRRQEPGGAGRRARRAGREPAPVLRQRPPRRLHHD